MATKPRRDISDNLRQRILGAFHLGTLDSGDRLPSVRQLARELRVDPRTVLAAYRHLAEEGLVRLRPRSGVFAVAPEAEEHQLPEVASWIVDVFVRGHSRGIVPTELRRQARLCLDTVRIRVACLECNDDQVYSLCRQARDDYGFIPMGLDLATLDGARRAAPLENADLLLTTRFHGREVQRLGRRLRRPVIIATLDPTFVAEIRRMLDAGPVWWICTDARFAAKLALMHPGAPVNPIVLGRDRLELVPADGTVYATTSAADRLPAGWHGGRVITIPRVFSAETARALVAFLVQRNLDAARASAKRSRLGVASRRRNSA